MSSFSAKNNQKHTIKHKKCPYDPNESIEEEKYEEHILICKKRPNITIEEQEDIERAKFFDEIASNQVQIKYIREKEYKGCVEKPELIGLNKKKHKKNKKQKKLIDNLSNQLQKREERHIAALDKLNNMNNDKYNDDEDSHEIKDFKGDNDFDLENEDPKEKNDQKKSKKEDKNKDKNRDKDKKEYEKKQFNNLNIDNNFFYKYDPNDEDKEITELSANVIVPDTIRIILKSKKILKDLRK